MVTSVLPRLLLVAVVLAGGLVLSAPPARACSCAFDDPAEMIAAHDAGFLGSVADVRRAGWDRRVWTFEVQRWLKGDLGDTVTVSTSASGASCGFELKVGDEAAILLRIEGNDLSSGLCSTLDADVGRAFLDPPKPSADGKATMLAAGGGGDNVWLFDDDGGLVASQANRGGELLDLDVCPGGRRTVEVRERRLVVRSLVDLRPVRRVAVPADVGRAWCQDAKGRDVLVARRDERTGDWRSIAALDALDDPLAGGSWVDVDVVGDSLVATVGREHTELWVVSLTSPESDRLHVAGNASGVPLDVEPSIEGFDVSPDGERVVFEVTRYPAEGAPSSEVFVYHLPTRELVARASFHGEGAEVRWLDDSRVALTSYEHAPLVLRADDLAVQARLPAEASWVAAAAPDGRLVGMDGPSLSAVHPVTGDTSVLALVPTQYTGWFERLPRALRVAPVAQQSAGEPAAVLDASATSATRANARAESLGDPGERRGILPAVAAIVAALAALMVARHRRTALER